MAKKKLVAVKTAKTKKENVVIESARDVGRMAKDALLEMVD
jgi:hypothetical protein